MNVDINLFIKKFNDFKRTNVEKKIHLYAPVNNRVEINVKNERYRQIQVDFSYVLGVTI